MGSDRRPTVPPKYPHFFKIIVPHTIGSGKLMIPKMFVSKYGKTLSDSLVYLKVPNGRVWKIDVTRKNGEVSLNGRWTQFAKHYSLQLGYMLVFQHQGNSTFSVVILDTSASEIEYPSCNILGQEPITTPNAKPCHEGDISDDFVPITRCQKRQQNNSINETENVVKLRRSKRARLDEEVHRPVQDVQAHRRRRTNIYATINSEGKDRALEKSGSFESSNPYFKIVMQPSYAQSYLAVPLEFADKHLPLGYSDASLTISDGRRWSVRYGHTVRNYKKHARFYCGWKSFAKDNALEVGDVCVFELKDPTIISFQVVIFRLTTDNNGPGSQDTGSVADRAKPTGMKGSKMEAKETDLYVKGNSKKLKCKAPILGRVVNLLSSCSEVPRALAEAKKFVSEHPCFLLFMSPGYMSRTAICVPARFVNEYLKKSVKFVTTTRRCDAWVTLEVADRLWNVNLVTYGSGWCKLCGGWPAFARGNNLRVGDACVFELISIPNAVMKVTVFKCV